MAFYRTEDGKGFLHVNFGRKKGPAPCAAVDADLTGATVQRRCNRMSVALCDYQVGQDLDGRVLTCDAPMCHRHRKTVGPDRDHCPRHAHEPAAQEHA